MTEFNIDNTYDAIVIGSGIGGLTAGALLSKAGKKVIVIEKQDRCGGYAQSFKRKGYQFDSSIHFTGGGFDCEEQRQGVIYKTLELLKVEQESPFLPLDPFCQIHLPDFVFEAPAEYTEFEEKLCKTFPTERKQIRRLFKLCLRLDDDLRRLPDKLTLFGKIIMPFSFPRVVRYGSITVEKALNKFFKDKNLIATLASFGACFAMPITRMSFAMWSHIFVSIFAERVSYCKGSFQNLANALEKALTSYRGTIIKNCEVTSIIIEGEQAKGVVLANGESLIAPLIISNADLRHTYEGLVDRKNVPANYLSYIQSLVPSLSCFTVYIGTDLPLHTMGLTHEMLLFDTANISKWFHNSDIQRDSNIIVSIPSLVDDSLSPKGKDTLSIISFIPYQQFSATERKKFADFLISKVNSIIPGLSNHIDYMETAIPTTFNRYTNNYKGSSLGWEVSKNQLGEKRPDLKSPISGLWHTGQWTKPGGGVYGTMVSGRKVSQKILGYKNATDFVHAMKELP